MKAGKTTTKEKLGIAVLTICLTIELALIGLALGFDSWVTKSATSVGDDVEDKQWLVGLWRSCLIPATRNSGVVVMYPVDPYNCTDITNLDMLRTFSFAGDWKLEVQLLSLVLILLAATMIIAALAFFVCGYLPMSHCKTCGLGGLPAVLITAGVCQASCLVSVYFMSNMEMVPQLSYYLTIGNLLPTLVTAIATMIVTCRAI